MKPDLIHSLNVDFEAHAKHTDSGIEFCLTRDLQQLLGYTKWDNFQAVTFKAKITCEVSGHGITDHFADVGKKVALGSGAETEIPDSLL